MSTTTEYCLLPFLFRNTATGIKPHSIAARMLVDSTHPPTSMMTSSYYAAKTNDVSLLVLLSKYLLHAYCYALNVRFRTISPELKSLKCPSGIEGTYAQLTRILPAM